MPRSTKIIFYALLALAQPGAVLAQSSNTASSGRLEQQAFPEVVLPPRVEIPSPREKKKALPPVPSSLAQTAYEVKTIVFQSAGDKPLVTASLLAPLAAEYSGNAYDAAGLEALAKVFTNHLRNDGFILSFVTQASAAADGVLTFTVHELGLRRVVFMGDAALLSASLRQEWEQTLLQSVPLQQATLERLLLILNDIPGLSVGSTLFQDKESGGVSLQIEVERSAQEAQVNLDNRGSRFIGPWQVSVAGTVNGLFSAYDSATLRGLSGTDNQELQGIDARYQTLIRSDGTALTLNALRIWSEPGFTLEENHFENIITRLSAEVAYPVIKQRSENLDVIGRFTLRNSQTKVLGDYLSDDRQRSIAAGVRYDKADSLQGISQVSVELHQGLDILNARESGSDLLSRANGRSDFSKITATFNRVQRFASSVSLLLSIDSQYSATQLLSSEEFSYGGTNMGRGYDPSELVGDHGIAGLIEMRFDTPFHMKETDLSSVQWYASYDAGAVWAIDSKNRFDRQTGASAAIGLRFNLDGQYSLDMQLAKPLTRSVSTFSGESANDPRGFLSFSARY